MDIRRAFLDFFVCRGHQVYDSIGLVPRDSTLLFTNAGMVQFKDVFTGLVSSPQNKRATSSQLCIRAGGKHNDLENVGYTNRHHTLFEMLGNFSFGDYFKQEAISQAWIFLTDVLHLPKELLYVSVHDSDDEAFDMWSRIVPVDRIKRMGDKDNFWQMGDVGPCGPCSEIYIDQGADRFHGDQDYFGGDGDRFLEIWNLVFMQYDRDIDGTLRPIPCPSIDTGMGLERIQAVLEGEHSNFHSSLFRPIIHRIERVSGLAYDGNHPSFRVIADHARSICFLLAQDVLFDKEGRGYVARRILRRALRHGYLLGLKRPFLHDVIDSVVDVMGSHYTYLFDRLDFIKDQCRNEEERFLQTIESGMQFFRSGLDSTLRSGSKSFSGELAFKLYDTYGFPLDLTQDMLLEHNISLDTAEFEQCMKIQKDTSRSHWRGSGDDALSGDFRILLDKFGPNEFVGYEHSEIICKVLAVMDKNFKICDALPLCSISEGAVLCEGGSADTRSMACEVDPRSVHEGFASVHSVDSADLVDGYVLLDRTPFYPQGGGPVGDSGELLFDGVKVADVVDTRKYFGLNIIHVTLRNERSLDAPPHPDRGPLYSTGDELHAGRVPQSDCTAESGFSLRPGVDVLARVSNDRLEISKHHSATHLLNTVLREVLGLHVTQAGSLVQKDRLRFDFTHPRPLSRDELDLIERKVNDLVFMSLDSRTEMMSLDGAKSRGALALFCDKYTDLVRVVSFGSENRVCSIELCGGIHVRNTSLIGCFHIIKESGVGSGVRRIEASCGRSSYDYFRHMKTELELVRSELKSSDIVGTIRRLRQKGKQSTSAGGFDLNPLNINGVSVFMCPSPGDSKSRIDLALNKFSSVVILLTERVNDKLRVFIASKNAKVSARDLLDALSVCGVKGGGRDDFIAAGCKDLASEPIILQRAREHLYEHL